ncbi:MAG: hypothetical protein KGJ23_12245 [Euryarchaeota archaeon]|nr:hypothetical protein [Euryarchaeota archaeon]MDE2045645.1 hypothetical protein [Thermoplasmata archaeon]
MEAVPRPASLSPRVTPPSTGRTPPLVEWTAVQRALLEEVRARLRLQHAVCQALA